MSESVRSPPLTPGTARVTIERNSDSMRRIVPSPKRMPLLPSSLYSVSWPRVSRVLLNCATNPSTAELRSEEHTSELQSLMRISYSVFCLKQKTHYVYELL